MKDKIKVKQTMNFMAKNFGANLINEPDFFINDIWKALIPHSAGGEWGSNLAPCSDFLE